MHSSSKIILLSGFAILQTALSQTLTVPQRPVDAPKESVFVSMITPLSLQERENAVYIQVISGNIPEFMRTLSPVTVHAVINGVNHTATYYVISDYLAVGSDDDYFLMPMTPTLAQRIANRLECSLPTKKMVDDIYAAAAVKLRPQPIPPSDAMTTVPVFKQHNDSVRLERQAQLAVHPLGALVGGDKKDVVITNRINNPTPTGRVAIYGWHQLNGIPIQPLYTGHADTWADYSHGIRLVQSSMNVDGLIKTVTEVLNDPNLAALLSDEGLIPNTRYPTPPDSGTALPPPTPKSFGLVNENETAIRLKITFENDTTGYVAYLGSDGVTFPDSVSLSKDNPVIGGLKGDSLYFIRVRAVNSAGYSPLSEVLGCVASTNRHKVLIVNGFDRGSAGNTFNFVRQHGQAFYHNGYAFCSATNDAVQRGLISLNSYEVVDYVLGDESTLDETFSTAEQETVKTFLRAGGKLFASGSEIAWDLDYKGTISDKNFCAQYLKSRYVSDAPNSQPGVYYQVEPLAGGIFNGLGLMSFDNGFHGTINVKWPDVISGTDGGLNCLAYAGLSSNYAGISYEGIFPFGKTAGKVVTLGIPFETLYPDSMRDAVMKRILTFFETPLSVANDPAENPGGFFLFQNYPNPFNPSTTIDYQLSAESFVSLKVFDILGREVATLVNNRMRPGQYTVKFGGEGLSSGIYFYCLQSGGYLATRQMVLMK